MWLEVKWNADVIIIGRIHQPFGRKSEETVPVIILNP